MAGVFVRLKLRVLAHSLRGGRRAVLFVVGAVYGLVGGVASAVLPLAAGSSEAGTDLLAAVVAVWALGWIVGPIAFGGGDETIRPENFALLPLSPLGLARGMSAASLVGIAPVATLLAFTGHLVLGVREGTGPALVAVIGLALELGVVVLCSRVVVAALSAVLVSRRGQDVGVLLASLAALAYIPLQLLGRALGPALSSSGGDLGRAGTVLRALPTGWAAVAVRATAAGDPLLVLGLALPVFTSGAGTAGLAYASVWLTVLAASQLGNLYGLDGGSVWHLLVVPGAARADVRGRQLAWLALVAPAAVLAAVLGPLATGSATAAPWVAGLTPVLLGAGAGLVVLQSAYVPIPLPQGRRANPFAGGGAGSGAGCTRALAVLAFLLLLVPAALPVLALDLLGLLTGTPALAWVGLPVGVAVGAGLAWWWGALAQRRLRARGPEILTAVRQAG